MADKKLRSAPLWHTTTRRGALAAACTAASCIRQRRPVPHVSGQINGLRHKASITARAASDHNLYQRVLQTMGVACRSPHVLSLVNQEAVTDQRCPNATTNSTATKLAIPTQRRRIYGPFACWRAFHQNSRNQ